MKRLFLYLLVLSFLGGCAALKPPEKKVVKNTFYSSSPKLEVEVSPDLEYIGERMHSKDVEEIHEGADFTLFHEAFIFQGPNQLVTITILKAPDNAFFLEPSRDFAEIKNKLEIGKCKLGKHTFYYCIFRLGNQLVKFHARNVYGGSMQVRIFYQETENQEVVSDRELLRQLNENCEAAFRVK
jgi:hypothetical protein